jgi:hypothetical protein
MMRFVWAVFLTVGWWAPPGRCQELETEAIKLENYVARFRGSGPAVGMDLERLPRLRDAAAKPWERQDTARDIVWVLVRHEWLAYRQSSGRLARRASGWRLRQAVTRLQEVALVKGPAAKGQQPQPLSGETVQRLFLARSYLEAVAEADRAAEDLTDERLRQIAREALNKFISPADPGPLNHDIQEPIQRLFKTASESLAKAAIAQNRAQAALATVHGLDPKDVRQDSRLSARERQALSTRFDEVKKQIAEYKQRLQQVAQAAVSDSEPSVVERYAALREKVLVSIPRPERQKLDADSMKINGKAGKAPKALNAYFRSNTQDERLRGLLADFVELVKTPQVQHSLKDKADALKRLQALVSGPKDDYMAGYLEDPTLLKDVDEVIATAVDRLKGGLVPRDLEERLARLRKGFEELGITGPPRQEVDELLQQVERALKQLEARLKVPAVGGGGSN